MPLYIRFRDFDKWRLCRRLYQVTELTAVVTKRFDIDVMKFTETRRMKDRYGKSLGQYVAILAAF